MILRLFLTLLVELSHETMAGEHCDKDGIPPININHLQLEVIMADITKRNISLGKRKNILKRDLYIAFDEVGCV